jgi:YggT family protein
MGFLIVRIVGSWFPDFSRKKFMRFVAFYTDPYLNLFRRIIPPIGGVLDLTPMIAWFALQILKWLILIILGKLGLC